MLTTAMFYASSNMGNEHPFANFLSQSRNGSIIITTRNKNLARRLTSRSQNIVEVGPIAQTDTLTFLEKKLGPLPDLDIATKLVQALDFVPLAISQATTYIQAKRPRSSPTKYLTKFRESELKQSKLLQYDSGKLHRDGGASNAILII